MKKDIWNRTWITENALEIIPQYESGVLTLRGLYYKLVGLGMTNDFPFYKRVVAAMTVARRKGLVAYDAFSDHDRQVIGSTNGDATDLDEEIDTAMGAITNWMNSYSRNMWENQEYFVEVWVEKKTLIGVLEKPCSTWNVALCPCKGYPSLTYLKDASNRFKRAKSNGQKPIILYFGDYDSSGVDIPRKIGVSMDEDFGIDIEIEVVSLNKEQVLKWKLPIALSKKKDSRTASFEQNGGLGQVELDAVDPNDLQKMCSDAISNKFDEGTHDLVKEQAAEERIQYRIELKEFVNDLAND
jgi:hypothetical protein